MTKCHPNTDTLSIKPESSYLLYNPYFLFSPRKRSKSLKFIGFVYKKREKVIISSKKNKRSKIIYTIAILLIVIMVGLTSGYFKYQAIVIATGSMTPNINKGDIVIVEKLNEKEILNLKKGEILVFHREDKIVVHRIYEVYSSGYETFFKTKGDHNESPDGYLIETSEVIGTVKFKIRYIGYPTVALNEKINS